MTTRTSITRQFLICLAFLALLAGCSADAVSPVPAAQPTSVPDAAQSTGIPAIASPTGAPANFQPSIQLNPATGTAGTQVTVTGTGFPANSQIAIHLGLPDSKATADAYGGATADANGTLTAQFTLPATWSDGQPVTSRDLVVTAANADFSVKTTATLTFQPANLVTITGQIKTVDASARVLNLTEPVEGFSVVTLTDKTEIISKDDNTKTLAGLKPGMQIEATGQPGTSGAVIASSLRVLSAPAPSTTSGQWDHIQLKDVNLTVDVPGGWKQLGQEYAWSNPTADTQRVGINWIARQPGVEPTSLLPNHATSLDAAPLDLSWGQAMKHTVEVSAPAASGGGSVALETHVIVLTDKWVYDFYASATAPDELDALWPTLQHMLQSVK